MCQLDAIGDQLMSAGIKVNLPAKCADSTPAKAKTFEKWKPPGRVKQGQNLLSITPLIMFLIDFLFLPTIYYQTTNMAIKSSHSLKWHVHKSCFFLQSKWTDILFTVL